MAEEKIDIVPFLRHVLVKSPTPVDRNGRTVVEVELATPYGFELTADSATIVTSGDRVSVFLHFVRKP